jgi:hypothetical protein
LRSIPEIQLDFVEEANGHSWAVQPRKKKKKKEVDIIEFCYFFLTILQVYEKYLLQRIILEGKGKVVSVLQLSTTP